MNSIIFLAAYLVTVNVIGFALMGIDKHKARVGAFRIPEGTLFITAIIGGSIGSIIGMRFFRHKTRKFYFVWGMPIILALQIAIVILLWRLPIDFRFI